MKTYYHNFVQSQVEELYSYLIRENLSALTINHISNALKILGLEMHKCFILSNDFKVGDCVYCKPIESKVRYIIKRLSFRRGIPSAFIVPLVCEKMRFGFWVDTSEIIHVKFYKKGN